MMKLPLCSTRKIVAWLAVALAIVALPMQVSYAKNQVMRGEIAAQYVCHDGANRGATIGLLLSKYPHHTGAYKQKPSGETYYSYGVQSFADIGGKTYYSRTTCTDLRGKIVRPGDKVYAWFTVVGRKELCDEFNVVYRNNGKRVWVQNGGSHIRNVTCVAKDSI